MLAARNQTTETVLKNDLAIYYWALTKKLRGTDVALELTDTTGLYTGSRMVPSALCMLNILK